MVKFRPRIVRDGESTSLRIFIAEGDITLKNIFVICRTVSGLFLKEPWLEAKEDSIDVTVQKVVWTDGRGKGIHLLNADMVNLKVTDCMAFDVFSETNHNSGGFFCMDSG